jgi:two-component system, NtrC family, response regulator GlrR
MRDMSVGHTTLVVDSDPRDLRNTVMLLRSHGFFVTSAATFDEAKQKIAREPPDLLVTALRLGAYNGLHLVLRTRADHPSMAALVTTYLADPVLQAEATRHHAGFLVVPVSDADFLTAIANVFPATPPEEVAREGVNLDEQSRLDD